jgi:hypothetical protein
MSKQTGRGRSSTKLSASLVALLMTAMVVAFAVPSHASAAGPYGGFASGTVAHAHALDVMGTKVANVEIGQSNAAVVSEGIPGAIYNEFNRPIVPKSFAGKNSYGQGSLAEVGLGVGKDDPNQIAPFVSEVATSNGPKFDDKDPLHVPGDPLLWVDGLHTTAAANWNPDTCILGEPISAGQSTGAAAQVINIGTGTNGDDSFDAAAITAGVVHSHAFEQLYKGKGDGLGLASVAVTNAVHLKLLEGTPAEIEVNVAPAFLIVKADGTPTKKEDAIKYEAPAVQIKAGGQVVNLLTDITGPVHIDIPPGASDANADYVLNLNLGTLLPLASSTGPTIKSFINAAGTEASASVNVADISVLKVPEVPFEALRVSVGHLEAAAAVPAGGVDCPIPVTKTPSVDTVESGHSFTTTIKIKNPWVCPLENVSLTDVITTEGDSTFKITDTNPNADSPDIPTADGLTSATVKWNNLGTIAPGGTKTVVVTLLAGGGAGKIKDTATAAGSVSNCKPAPGSSGTEVTGITNVKVPVKGVGTLTVPETKVAGKRLAVTGLGDKDWTWAGLLLLIMATFGAVTLRRRSHSNA